MIPHPQRELFFSLFIDLTDFTGLEMGAMKLCSLLCCYQVSLEVLSLTHEEQTKETRHHFSAFFNFCSCYSSNPGKYSNLIRKYFKPGSSDARL